MRRGRFHHRGTENTKGSREKRICWKGCPQLSGSQIWRLFLVVALGGGCICNATKSTHAVSNTKMPYRRDLQRKLRVLYASVVKFLRALFTSLWPRSDIGARLRTFHMQYKMRRA